MSAKSFALLLTRLLRTCSNFNRNESGALLIFGLVLFTLMAIMGGIALDLMRYETTRVTLQNTLDRSTLAAASLTNDMDPEAVVRDYFLKAGMSEQLAAVTVTEAMNDRRVRAVGVVDTQPFFMHMIGVDDFRAKARAMAQQSITNVEIVLVLDVSGSMSGQKIADLKVSAMEFVDNMLANDPEHRVSISIVPYNAQVNIGPELRDAYANITHKAGVANVNCVEIPPAAFATSAMPTDIDLPMMAYADINNGTSLVNSAVSPTSSYALPSYGAAYCKPSTVNIVRLPSNDATTLKAQINALQAGGNTSIVLGMKWGLTLIDPSSRPMYADFIAGGQMSDLMVARPFDYDDHEAMKVIVLMTDGDHVAHNRVNDAYKTGPSPIWRNAADGQYSIYHASQPGLNKYYVPHLNLWQPLPWGLVATQQNWEQIWSNLKLTYFAWQFYGRALGTDSASRSAVYNSTVNAMRSTFASETTMDSMLQQSCTLAKQAGVIVYGIAFEAPVGGQEQISTCASSVDAHYFNATDGDEMQTAFQTISSNLSQLKLTQ
jgi:hypothetical protein